MRVLLTAFEPYGDWSENSSWLTLVELLRTYQPSGELVTRRYPVDLQGVQDRLRQDLDASFDAILHLGQAPGQAAVKLEAVALNAAGLDLNQTGGQLPQLVPEGPLAYASQFPLGSWRQLLATHRVPARVSYHAGTYLCNALFYLAHHSFSGNPAPPIGFVHLPLASEQVATTNSEYPSLPLSSLATCVRVILDEIYEPYELA